MLLSEATHNQFVRAVDDYNRARSAFLIAKIGPLHAVVRDFLRQETNRLQKQPEPGEATEAYLNVIESQPIFGQVGVTQDVEQDFQIMTEERFGDIEGYGFEELRNLGPKDKLLMLIKGHLAFEADLLRVEYVPTHSFGYVSKVHRSMDTSQRKKVDRLLPVGETELTVVQAALGRLQEITPQLQ